MVALWVDYYLLLIVTFQAKYSRMDEATIVENSL